MKIISGLSSESVLTEKPGEVKVSRTSPRGRRAFGTAMVLLAVLVMAVIEKNNSTILAVLTESLVYGIAIGSLDLVVGFVGLLSVGQVGLLGVGAYTVALLNKVHPLPVLPSLVAGGLTALLVGAMLGMFSLRLKGHYFTLVTLAFGLVVPQVALNLSSVTNGDSGLIVPPGSVVGGWVMSSPMDQFILVFIVATVSFGILERFLLTTMGRKSMAVRDNELAAISSGINVYRVRLVVFMWSSFFAGISGGLLAYFSGLVAPSSFPFQLSLFFLAALIVGGSGRYTLCFAGSLVGSLALAGLQQATVSSGSLAEVALGLAVIVIVVVSGRGLWTIVQSAAGKVFVSRVQTGTDGA